MMSSKNPLQPFLDRSGFVLLDGGLATELENRGHNLNDPLWSARLLHDAPGEIYQVHLDYLEAGSDCIITASYQASIAGFRKKGFTDSEAEALLNLSVELAIDARDEFWSIHAADTDRVRPIVAASIGPYGAAKADGSEYTGEYDLDEEGLFRFHHRRFHLLAATRAELLACETIPSYEESKALAQLLKLVPDRFAWFSFTCKDRKHISDGTPLALCIRELEPIPQIAAVGINCTSPSFIPALIQEVRSVSSKPILVYPNSGEDYDSSTRTWTGESDSHDFAEASHRWRSEGASIVGGCCRTGPGHIRQMRRRLLR